MSRMTVVRQLVPLMLLNLSTGCTAGVVGGAQTLCDQAADHVAACGVSRLPDTGECNATKQRLAAQILSTPCSDMPLRQTFSSSKCDSIWSQFFYVSCWGHSGSDDSGSDDNTPSGGECKPLGAFCYLDEDCCSQQCDWDSARCFKQTEYSTSCYCDNLCVEMGDCCDDC
jgi:hypothetical protein